MIRIILKTLKSPNDIFGNVGGYILLCMMLLTVCDVIGRYAFNSPITGAYEITEIMMVTAVFFLIPYTQEKKGHIAVDLVVILLPKKLRILIDIITHTLSLLLFILIAWMNVVRSIELMRRNEYTPILEIPVSPFVLVVAFGALLFCFEIVRDLIKLLKH